MSLISYDEDESIIMLKPSDFPNYYEDFIHPTDYTIFSTPFIEKIFHKKRFHNRLLIRMCFKIDDHSYIPVTFVIDTGCPMNLYLCKKIKDQLSSRIKVDEFETEYISVENHKNFTVDDTPHIHHNVNIIGLMMLNYLGFFIENDEFGFAKEIDFL